MGKVKVYNENGVELKVQHSTFPAGEVYVKVLDTDLITEHMIVELRSASSEQVMRAIMISNALTVLGATYLTLESHYLPYSRQDRVCNTGESDSLAVLLSTLELWFDNIITLDIHNYPQSIGTIIDSRMPDYGKHIDYTDGLVIVSPDKGAVERCQLAADGLVPVATLSKTREPHGITQSCTTEVDFLLIKKATKLVIVDDICDGGATFLSAAKVLRELNPNAELHLLVTHGIFSQGMEKLEEVFTSVKAVNYYTKG